MREIQFMAIDKTILATSESHFVRNNGDTISRFSEGSKDHGGYCIRLDLHFLLEETSRSSQKKYNPPPRSSPVAKQTQQKIGYLAQ